MMTYALAAAIALLALTLFVGALSPENRLSLAVVLIFAVGATGQIPSASAYAFRVAAVVAAAGAVLGFLKGPRQSPQASLARLAVILTAILAVPVFAHREFTPFLNSLVGTLLLLLVSFAAQRSDTKALVRGFNAGAWGIIVLSTPLIAVPSLGVVGSNFRGITANSNSLGIYCVLAVASALFLIRVSGLKRIFLIAWPITLCVMAHSRTSLIAIALLVAFSAAIKESAGRRLIMAAALAAAVILLIDPAIMDQLFGGVANKTTGTRDLSVAEAQRSWESNRLLGLGFDGIHYQVASSPLRAVAAGGAVMLSLYIAAAISMLTTGIRAGSKTFLFACVAVIHSFGEGWMISTTGPWILAFSAGLATFAASDNRVRSPLPAPPARVKASRRRRPGDRGGHVLNET